MMAAMDGEIAHPFGDGAAATFTAPAGLTLAGFRLWRHMAVGPVAPFGARHEPQLHGRRVRRGPLRAEPRLHDARQPVGAAGRRERGGGPNLSGVRQVTWDATCGGAPNQNPCPASGAGTRSAVYNVFAADMLLNDPAPPTVSGVGGPLLAGGTSPARSRCRSAPRTPAAACARARSRSTARSRAARARRRRRRLCGPRRLRGQPARVRQHAALPATLSGLLTLDTDALSPGRPRARGVRRRRRRQRGGRGHEHDHRRRQRPGGHAERQRGVARGQADRALDEHPQEHAPPRLRRAPDAHRPARRRGGQPIAGAAVEILVRERSAGAADQPIATVTTGPDGAFRTQLPSGPRAR